MIYVHGGFSWSVRISWCKKNWRIPLMLRYTIYRGYNEDIPWQKPAAWPCCRCLLLMCTVRPWSWYRSAEIRGFRGDGGWVTPYDFPPKRGMNIHRSQRFWGKAPGFWLIVTVGSSHNYVLLTFFWVFLHPFFSVKGNSMGPWENSRVISSRLPDVCDDATMP